MKKIYLSCSPAFKAALRFLERSSDVQLLESTDDPATDRELIQSADIVISDTFGLLDQHHVDETKFYLAHETGVSSTNGVEVLIVSEFMDAADQEAICQSLGVVFASSPVAV